MLLLWLIVLCDMIHLEKFQSGRLLKHTTGYNYFLPNTINGYWQWEDTIVNDLLERAAIKLGELNAFARLVPNIELFIQLHVTKEAVVSSRIEGTRTRVDEAFLNEEEIPTERRNDWKEVNNYINALNEAIAQLEELPISSRLLCRAHKRLLLSARGEHKLPGEFRRSQNWIGGSSLHDAVFIPPHHDHIASLMGDLENFLHNDKIRVPNLIKIAIAHYQFETIHPFLDGNGRIGRLLITLFLVDQGILEKPLLYLSSYFEKNRSLYYDHLTSVRTKNDMKQWIKYFLAGMVQTADNATNTLSAILHLKTQLESNLNQDFGRRANSAYTLLQQLFKRPVTQVNQVKQLLNVSFKAANDLVTDFARKGILREMTGQSRNRVFIFEDYIQLFRI